VTRLGIVLVALMLVLTACGSSASRGGPSSAASSADPGQSCQEVAGLTGKVSDHGTQRASGTAIHLDGADFYFEPTCVQVERGALTVTVENVGQALHNLSVPSLGIDRDVEVGRSIRVSVRFNGSQPVPFFCKYHVGAGMQGAFLPG
jgi:plastocyanin